MPVIDILDISRYQTITDRDAVGPIPIVHKVNEGFSLDPTWLARREWIADREIFGGYTVLLPGDRGGGTSTIRQQIETYARAIEPVWRDGAFSQLDVESWHRGGPDGGYRYGRPMRVDEIQEAAAIHDQLLGPGRVTVYMNRNEPGMSSVFAEWSADRRGRPYWMPGYSGARSEQAAIELRADIWQWTSSTVAWPGINNNQRGNLDANEVRNWDALYRVTNLMTDQEKDTSMNIVEPNIRITDTRVGNTTLVPVATPQVVKLPPKLKLLDGREIDSRSVKAAQVNIGVTQTQAAGHLVAYMQKAPGTANVNWDGKGQTRSNLATVPCYDGGFQYLLAGSPAEVVFDLQGVYL